MKRWAWLGAMLLAGACTLQRFGASDLEGQASDGPTTGPTSSTATDAGSGGNTTSTTNSAGGGSTTSSAGGDGGDGGEPAGAGGTGATTSTGPGGQGGAGGQGGGDCATTDPFDYALLQVSPGDVVVDGSCDDAAWAVANEVVFNGYDGTDNDVTCRLLWQNQPDRIFGCCSIVDDDLEADITTDDTDDIWQDDSIELMLAAGLDDTLNGDDFKVIINVANATWDADFVTNNNVSADFALSSAVVVMGSLNNGSADVGWDVEWAMDAPFAVDPELRARCEMMLNDSDGDQRFRRKWHGSGDGYVNVPAQWADCRYACDFAL